MDTIIEYFVLFCLGVFILAIVFDIANEIYNIFKPTPDGPIRAVVYDRGGVDWNKDKTNVLGEGYPHFNNGSFMFEVAGKENELTIPLYVLSNVGWVRDEPTFIADATFVADISNKYNRYFSLWFQEPCKKALAELEQEYKSTCLLKIKKKRNLKMRITRLGELIQLSEQSKPSGCQRFFC